MAMNPDETGLDPATSSTAPDVNAQGGNQAPGDATYEVPGHGAVDLPELINGYLRNDHYTQGRQQLARDRQAMQNGGETPEEVREAQRLLEMLDDNPERTIQTLAASYGVGLNQSREEESDDVDDPVSRNVQHMRQEMQFMRQELEASKQYREESMQEKRAEKVGQELVGLHQQYGDFNDGQVLQYAMSKGHFNLEEAYLAMNARGGYERGIAEGRQQAITRTEGSVEFGSTPPARTEDNLDLRAAMEKAYRDGGG